MSSGREVEVAAGVQRRRVVGRAEVEVLDLRGDVEGVAALLGRLELASQHAARVAFERVAVAAMDVADHPRDAVLLRPPGQHDERVRVRQRDHVRLVVPGEALNRRAVELNALLQRGRQFVDRDRDRLQLPQQVGEPEPDEADVVLAARIEDVLVLTWWSVEVTVEAGHLV